VNNIYFDTQGIHCYFDSVDGDSHRLKIRIRWYGELFGKIERPILELKIKNGVVGRKESYALNPLTLDSHFTIEVLQNTLEQSAIPPLVKENMKKLSPSLVNQYSRKYFQSACSKYRITLDVDQSFYHITRYMNLFSTKTMDTTNVILELKYNKEFDTEASYITNYFPFRLTKSSKYINGMNYLLG